MSAIIERLDSPTVTLNVRITRYGSELLRELSPGAHHIGRVLETLIAAEHARRLEREKLGVTSVG